METKKNEEARLQFAASSELALSLLPLLAATLVNPAKDGRTHSWRQIDTAPQFVPLLRGAQPAAFPAVA